MDCGVESQPTIVNPPSTIALSRIPAIFASSRPVLLPFITGGFPSLRATRETLIALDQAGAGIIEVGFPFTDPIADGPVIAESMHKALLTGVTPRSLFDVVREVRPRIKAGLVAMVTDSIITRMGAENFVGEAAAAGFDGLIVPDIDLDAAVPLAGLARVNNLTFTLLIAPTTTEQRLQRIVELCTGWVYVLARVGVTGEGGGVLDESQLRDRIAQIRRHTALPLAVGFGISSASQVRTVTRLADGAIVGSALVRRIGEAGDEHAAAAAADFVRQLMPGLAARSG